MPDFRLGDRDVAVRQVRGWLRELGLLRHEPIAGQPGGNRWGDDEDFTPDLDQAVRAFQQSRGLRVDGWIGPETFRALEGARWRLGARVLHHQVSHPYVGDDVLALQLRLVELGFDNGRCDGVFGARTDHALRDFQRNYGLAVDGTLGPGTLRALQQLERTVVGGRSHELRESEALRGSGPSLAGRKVALDPGHGGSSTGAAGHGLIERELVADLTARLEGRLVALGVVPILTHGPDSDPSAEQRARLANETGADVLLSLHCDAATSPAANGVATFYYGTERDRGSVAGERLATLVQREIVARTDFLDARVHAKTWDLLRLTRMPAVHVECGYLTSAADARRLADPTTRDTLAEALLVAVQRLFLPEELDPPTGVLLIPALAP